MFFDIQSALSLPDIRQVVAKRHGVLERFGPLFRDPSFLAEQDYLGYLGIKRSHHWSDLERLGK